MDQTNLRTPIILSLIIAVLAVLASIGGLFLGVYRDNALVTAALRGNDLITLVLAVPFLTAALIYAGRGSRLALLVWAGMLGYMLYNYSFYLFGSAINALFLVYIALFTLSIYTLIFLLPRLDVEAIKGWFNERTPVRWIGGFMIAFGILLGTIWIAQVVGFLATGEVPTAITQTDHPTGVVFALDLSLLIPAFVLGGVWLWQRRPWGYVLASMMLIKGPTYALALVFMSVFGAAAGVPDAWAMVELWIGLGAAALVAAGFLLGNLQRPSARLADSR